jgi:hypothetical protein
MARGPSLLRAVVGIAKAVDRAGKQAERNRQRSIKAYERESQRAKRDADRQEKALQRDAEQTARESVKSKTQAIKDESRMAKECFDYRVEERRIAKEEIINEYMK